MQHRLRRSLGTIPGVCLACLLALSLMGCSSAAPAPVPTAAPKAAAPTTEPAKPTAPAASPTAAPTTVPAKKTEYPEKGRTITFIVPWPAGASTDVGARLFSSFMEKDLGVPFAVVNKPGSGTQIGLTELARSRADGYTVGDIDIWMAVLSYVQPDRKAIYTRADFEPIWMLRYSSAVWMVKADSPYKDLKDVLDAARANPGGIKIGDTGAMGNQHLASLLFEKAAGVKFTRVHFDGAAPVISALLGGHVDVGMGMAASAVNPSKAGQIRVLGIMDKERNKLLPDVPTFDELGYKGHYMNGYHFAAVPKGTPTEAVDALAASIRKAQADPEFVQKAENLGLTLTPNMGPKEVTQTWIEIEKIAKESLELAQQPES